MSNDIFLTATHLAIWLHNNYEEIAEKIGWKTQDNCHVEFMQLPKENKDLMYALASRLLKEIDNEYKIFYCQKCRKRVIFGDKFCSYCGQEQLWGLFG